jgi:hypothetical protein
MLQQYVNIAIQTMFEIIQFLRNLFIEIELVPNIPFYSSVYKN